MEEIAAIGAIGATPALGLPALQPIVAPSLTLGVANNASSIAASHGPSASSNNFAAWFAQEVQASNSKMAIAEQDMAKLATGQAPSLHEVMIHLEEAKLSLQLLAQVRNRLLDAYQEVMRMQV